MEIIIICNFSPRGNIVRQRKTAIELFLCKNVHFVPFLISCSYFVRFFAMNLSIEPSFLSLVGSSTMMFWLCLRSIFDVWSGNLFLLSPVTFHCSSFVIVSFQCLRHICFRPVNLISMLEVSISRSHIRATVLRSNLALLSNLTTRPNAQVEHITGK